MTYQIFPSILAADVLNLEKEAQAVLQAGGHGLHLDVMDNHYVPNLTYGPMFCEALKKTLPNTLIDVHLMTTPVDALIHEFATAGARRISIHPDATQHLDRSVQLIRDLGCEVGVALNPATSIECLQWLDLDFILVMTVNPGFGGQKLIGRVVRKIALIRERYPQQNICVDGGVSLENIAKLAQAGANQFVMGSAIFRQKDYREVFQQINQILSKHLTGVVSKT